MQHGLTIDTNITPGRMHEAEATPATQPPNQLTLYPLQTGEATAPNVQSISPFKHGKDESPEGPRTHSLHES